MSLAEEAAGVEESVVSTMRVRIAEFLAETDELSAEEFTTYFRLSLHCWSRGGLLPGDPLRLARLAHIDGASFAAVWAVVGKFFCATSDGGLTHKRLCSEMERARVVGSSLRGKAQKAWRASAAKRKKSKQLELGAQPEAELGVERDAQPGAELEAHVIRSAIVDPDPDPGHSAGPFSRPFPHILRLFSAIWTERYCESYMATGADRSQLGRTLKDFPDKAAIAAYPWEAAFRAYLADMDGWEASKKRHSLVNFCTNGGVNKYRVKDPTAGYSQREIRSMQHGPVFNDLMAAFDGGPSGRAR